MMSQSSERRFTWLPQPRSRPDECASERLDVGEGSIDRLVDEEGAKETVGRLGWTRSLSNDHHEDAGGFPGLLALWFRKRSHATDLVHQKSTMTKMSHCTDGACQDSRIHLHTVCTSLTLFVFDINI